MTVIRYTKDKKDEIYDSIKFTFNGTEVLPTISLFISDDMVKNLSNDELSNIDSKLFNLMRTLVTEYKLQNFSQGDLIKWLTKLKEHADAIQTIMNNERFFAYIQEKVADALLTVKNDGKEIMPWDSLLIDAPRIQSDLCGVLLADVGQLSNHRPEDTKYNSNQINKRFVYALAEVYEAATGRKATPYSESSNNRKAIPIIEKIRLKLARDILKQTRRATTPFIDFANAIITTINESYTGLNAGYDLVINVNDIIKQRNKNQ